jgi:hypothetical protein
MTLRVAYWICFAAALAVYLCMVLWTLPAISLAAGGLAVFDLRPAGYSEVEARAFLDALTEQGRSLYSGPQRLLDLAYPALLALVLIGAIRVFFARPWVRNLLIAAAVLGMLADYRENALVATLLAGDVSAAQIAAASEATIVKSIATGLVMTAVVLALLRAGVRRWRAR